MANRRSGKAVEAQVAVEQEETNQQIEKTEEELALEQALKDAEAHQAALNAALGKVEEKEEEVKVEAPADSHPDQCDPTLFGGFDINSDSCRDCAKDFTECANACKALKEYRGTLNKSAKVKTSTGSTGAKRATGVRGNIVLISSANSAAGKLDAALMRPEGASMDELRAIRGAVPAHIKYLNDNGFPIVLDGGRYYYRPAAA